MDNPQPAGAEAPADDAFMAELLEGGQAGEEQQVSAPQPEPERREQPEAREQPAAREPERIPLAEYLQERERRQAAEKRWADHEEAERRKQESQSAPGFWEDPDRNVKDAMKPLQEQLARERQERLDDRVHDSHERAIEKYGDEAVNQALQSYQQLRQFYPVQFQRLDQQIGAARRPVMELMKWHQQQTTFQEIGPDLDAYHQKLLTNPEFLARAAEASRNLAAGGSAQQTQQSQQQPRGQDGKFQAPKPTQQRAPLPSMRAAGSAAPVSARPSGSESGDDLLDEIFAAP